MWPLRFDLNIGESFHIPNADGNHVIRLLDIREHEWPDYFTNNSLQRTFASAEVIVEIDGQPVVLLQRPYELPVCAYGVRLYVECTYNWARRCEIAALADLVKDVRISALPEAEPWGPKDIVFPIENYRWRSSVYQNTWSALVPYNLLYYHRGEDFGAVPDRLDVVAIRAGEVIASPISKPQGSNCVTVQSPDGTCVSYCHMNLEQIRPDLLVGKKVGAGELLGRTGETWDGRRCQDWDPHLHIEFEERRLTTEADSAREYLYSPYPFLVQAYLRKYPDPILAMAGGNLYTLPGDNICLDGTRSVARDGEKIQAYRWKLSDGRVVNSAKADIRYTSSGLYAEELNVITETGAEDRDFAHVRVYDPAQKDGVACGFFYHTPVRGLRPGMPVLFWNRLQQNIKPPVMIDFGDGSPHQTIERECFHVYASGGIYTTTLKSAGLHDDPVTLKMRVFIED